MTKLTLTHKYQPPVVAVGEETEDQLGRVCLITGKQKTGLKWTLCKIQVEYTSRWGTPVRAWSSKVSVFVDSELAKAIATESEQTVAHYWRVSPNTIRTWKRALDLPKYTPGTNKLRKATVQNQYQQTGKTKKAE